MLIAESNAVIGTLGVTKKGMRSTVEKIPWTIIIEELQKIALTSTAHILRKVLSTDLRDPVYPKTYGLDLVIQEDNSRIKRHIFSNFICNISLNTTSANLTKKAICTWLAYK